MLRQLGGRIVDKILSDTNPDAFAFNIELGRATASQAGMSENERSGWMAID